MLENNLVPATISRLNVVRIERVILYYIKKGITSPPLDWEDIKMHKHLHLKLLCSPFMPPLRCYKKSIEPY